MRTSSPLPLPVKKVLGKLGQDIRDGRLRRRIPMELMAERAGTSRSTLTRVEKGDPTVSMGVYASVLFVLGMSEQLADMADLRHDKLGRMLEDERLPKRIRLPKRRK